MLSSACKEATLFCHMGPDLEAAACFSKPVNHGFESRCPRTGTSVSSHPCRPLNTSRCPPTSLSCGPSTLTRCHEWAFTLYKHEVAHLPGRGRFVYADKHCLGSPQQSTSVSDQLLKAQSLLLGFFCLQMAQWVTAHRTSDLSSFPEPIKR